MRPLPPQTSHGVSGILPAPPQTSQATRADHLAEGRPRHLAQLAGAAAALAGGDRRPRLGAVAVAVLAGADDVVGDLAPHPGRHLGQLDLDRDHDVAARRRRAAAAEAEAAPPPKKAWKMSSIEPKPAPGSKPPERSPSWP